MTIEEIKKSLNSTQYDFLRRNQRLGQSIILLALGGSYAYGTNTETSDVDIRGCAMNSVSDLLGLSEFEQIVDSATDTTVYSFNKLVGLLLNCNPNTIEMLGCKPEHYLHVHPLGAELLAHQKLFLSQRAIRSFGGYANQQLRRLENAIAHDRLSDNKKEAYLLQSLKNTLRHFETKYASYGAGSFSLGRLENGEVCANVLFQSVPVRELCGMLGDLSDAAKSYDKLNHRNHKKDDAHLNKHAMHLVRLYLMCIDILEKEQVVTYRADDRDLLMGIRSGQYQTPDGTYRQEFFDLVSSLDQRMKYAAENTSLPIQPDMRHVEDFVVSVNKRTVDMSDNQYKNGESYEN